MYALLFTEAASDVTITVEVENPTKVHVNSSVVYLRWNYSISGSDPFKEVDFFLSKECADKYIGSATESLIRISPIFPSLDRF